MDIQEMVDRRIAELSSQSEATRPWDGAAAASHEFYRRSGNGGEPAFETGDRGADNPLPAPVMAAPPMQSTADRLSEFGTIMDAALTKVAAQILEVTEQLAGDYARLEKNILKSKLEALGAVESVLDTAIFLRREARERLSQIEVSMRRPQMAPSQPTAPGQDTVAEPLSSDSGRASMHEGVAALFRRTL